MKTSINLQKDLRDQLVKLARLRKTSLSVEIVRLLNEETRVAYILEKAQWKRECEE